jgi:hypothetical protein
MLRLHYSKNIVRQFWTKFSFMLFMFANIVQYTGGGTVWLNRFITVELESHRFLVWDECLNIFPVQDYLKV